jgi:hypothetical protein
MAELKTKLTDASVTDFLNSIEDEEKRADSFEILKLMKQVTRQEPYESGREGDWFITGFSPRKQYLTFYVMGSYNPHADLLKKLGKHKTGVGCLYIKTLKDVDTKVLKELIQQSFKAAAKK